jgi:hypothetical protein
MPVDEWDAYETEPDDNPDDWRDDADDPEQQN